MTYEEALKYIHTVNWRGSKLGLSRTEELLGLMGNPQNDLKFVHVAGTNGKGSTCSMLANILRKAGYKTGLYTSPYLYRFNERMQIDGESISDSELAELTEYVSGFAESMKDLPTEFEIVTAIGFEYFKRNNCDIVVLEVGLGGLLDSTNVISTPVCEVITAIDFDHTQYLGETIEEIAAAKAGIIKEGKPCVFYGYNKDAEKVIREKCREMHTELYLAEHGASEKYELGLKGVYQHKNADLVLKITEVLKNSGFVISEKNIEEGFATVKFPGRFETLLEHPTLIVDGGHNPHGIRGTIDSLDYYYPDKKIRFVIGMMADKDVKGALEIILPKAKDFITVTPNNPRAMKCDILSDMICNMGGNAVAAGTVEDGIKLAVENSEDDEIICAIGSLYSYGEIKEMFVKGII